MQIRNLKRFVMDKLGVTYRPPAAPVTRKQSIGIVGAGPAGLVAAHDLCVAGHSVHVYEMTDRLGGMMIWGIPAFRLPPGIIDEDVERLMQRCPGLEVHLDTVLGRDVSLAELKERHDAVLLTIGAWWGKPMGIAGEDDERVVDGVGTNTVGDDVVVVFEVPGEHAAVSGEMGAGGVAQSEFKQTKAVSRIVLRACGRSCAFAKRRNSTPRVPANRRRIRERIECMQ